MTSWVLDINFTGFDLIIAFGALGAMEAAFYVRRAFDRYQWRRARRKEVRRLEREGETLGAPRLPGEGAVTYERRLRARRDAVEAARQEIETEIVS